MTKKYLFVSHGSSVHGAERALLESLRAFQAQGEAHLRVVLPRSAERSLAKHLEALGIGFWELDFTNTYWVASKARCLSFGKRNLYLAYAFAKILIKEKPDFVILNSIVLSPVLALLARLFGRKLIWSIHELGDRDHGLHYLFGRERSFRFIQALSHQRIFNSRFTKAYFEGTKAELELCDDDILYNAVDFPLAEALLENFEATGIWHILVSGRTSPSKGQMDIVRALAHLKKEEAIANFKLRLLGAMEGVYLEQLKEEVAAAGLQSQVEFIPFQEEVQPFYHWADIGITSSPNEAFGRISVEYLKAGLVTIGPKEGGSKEIFAGLEDLVFTYHPGDHLALAQVLKQVFQSSAAEWKPKLKDQQLRVQAKYNLQAHYEGFKRILDGC